MNKTIIEMAKQSLMSAERIAESALYAILSPLGENGLELTSRPDDMFSVISEYEPNQFKKIVKVRAIEETSGYSITDGFKKREELQMMLEGETEWQYLVCSEYHFLIEEIESALRADELL